MQIPSRIYHNAKSTQCQVCMTLKGINVVKENRFSDTNLKFSIDFVINLHWYQYLNASFASGSNTLKYISLIYSLIYVVYVIFMFYIMFIFIY